MVRNTVRRWKGKMRERLSSFVFDYLMKPAMKRKGRTPFSSEELRLVHRALMSQNLCCIDGKMVSSFEKEFAYAYGVP